jgi:hypothetical protein
MNMDMAVWNFLMSDCRTFSNSVGPVREPNDLVSFGLRRWIRVASETSFVSKQPKLEPKLVSALAETRHLFWLFRFNIETGNFGVSKQPKQTKDQPKKQQIC